MDTQQFMVSLPNPSCPTCGATEDLFTHQVYIGGQGYVNVTECRDAVGCWKRWEAKNGVDDLKQ